MPSLMARSLDVPDASSMFPHGRLDVVVLGERTLGRFTFEPGWRWSSSVGPTAGDDLCPATHLGVVLSGRLHVVTSDGAEGTAGPGDAFFIAPGHDAWVVGEESVVALDVEGAAGYADPA